MVPVELHPHDLLQVRAAMKNPDCVELASMFPFGSYPNIFDVLGEHIGVERSTTFC